MSANHSQASQGNCAPTQSEAPASSSCSCPGSTGSNSSTNAEHAPILSADINADLSGVQANADLLGHDLADIKIGLGIIDDVLGLVDDGVGTGLGLVDMGLGVVDDVLCGIA
jgi:hypothetical protein